MSPPKIKKSKNATMLQIEKFTVNALQENCYVVSDETKECVIIDCGASNAEEFKQITDYIAEEGLTPMHLLMTHAHIDHCIGNPRVFAEYGLKPQVHESDEPLLDKMQMQQDVLMPGTEMLTMPPVERFLTEQDTICFGSHTFTVIYTPGHSPGCVFYYCEAEKVAFSGDTLFKGSIGRTDFMGGRMFSIIQSLRQICQMDDDIRVLPGHGSETTIGYECAHNMYLDR